MTQKIFQKIFIGIIACFVSGCAFLKSEPEPIVITPEPISEVQIPCYAIKHKLGIIGVVEPVYVLPMKAPFLARIDTGAETSSIDAQNIKFFERDSEKWVSFDIVNRLTGVKHHYEKKIFRRTAVKRIEAKEERIVVEMSIRFGNEIITAQFSLADRSKFEYPVLIGRNILAGRAVVDAAAVHTLP